MGNYYVETPSPLLRRQQATLVFGAPGAAPHRHPAVELLYFSKGLYRVEVGGQSFTAREGSLAVFRGNSVHAVAPLLDDALGYYIFMIQPSLVFSAFSGVGSAYPMLYLTPRFSQNGVFFAETLSEETRRILHSSLPLAGDENGVCTPYVQARLRIKLSDLLYSLAENELRDELPNERELPDEATIRQIYDSILFIDEYFDQPITPVQCAKQLHMSYSCFAKRFSQVIGCSFKQYLFGVRMSHAESLLTSTDRSVTEIALACGYSNVSHFISEFRRNKGSSPLVFRKRLRQVD